MLATEATGAGKTGSTGGLIVIDQQGRIGYACNTTHMPVCFVRNGASEPMDDEMIVVSSSSWRQQFEIALIRTVDPLNDCDFRASVAY